MDEVIGKSKASRRLLRNLIAGLCGFVVAFVLLMAGLRVQDYVPAWFVKVLLFAAPLPLACGLAVGLVSPRKAIAWAPLWSGIFALMLLAWLSGGVHEVGMALSPARVACVFAGALLSAGAGLLGQWAAHRGHVMLSILGLALICCLMCGLGYLLYLNQMQVYERDAKPQVIMEADRDLIALPATMEWKCERRFDDESYTLTSTLNGRAIVLVAPAAAPSLSHVDYCIPVAHENLRTQAAVRAYLKKWGVRDGFLVGLAELKDSPGCWRSVLRGARLTAWRDGRVEIDALPVDSESPRKPLGR